MIIEESLQTILTVIKLKRLIIFTLLLLILLCGCNDTYSDTFTVGTGNEFRTVIGYGTVVCDSIRSINISKRALNVVTKVSVGDEIRVGDVIVMYNMNGDECIITADTDGIITKITDSTIEYYDMNNIRIITKIGEADASDINVDMPVNITGSGFDKESYQGKISRISSIADKSVSGVFIDCDIIVLNPDLSMIPGFTARVDINVPTLNQVIVPLDSLMYDGKFYVNKISNGTLCRVNVNSGTVCGELCTVSGEIRAGDIIALNTNGEKNVYY